MPETTLGEQGRLSTPEHSPALRTLVCFGWEWESVPSLYKSVIPQKS